MGYWRSTATVAALSFFISFSGSFLLAQTGFHPKIRITGTIDEHDRVMLRGNRHPLAQLEYEAGLLPPDRPMERMILALDSDPEQQKALEQLIADQHNPNSGRYHQWLTPENFGGQFGVSDRDLAQVVQWLKSRGLEVNEIPAGRRSIVFSGSVDQVESAFHTQVRAYRVGSEMHYANATEPEIPRALAGVIHGVVALHDFYSQPSLSGIRPVAAPQFSATGAKSYMAPADFAIIYDLGPLYQNSVTGAGQSVAVVARCNVHMSDVQTLRSYFGLPVNNPTVILNGPDPGIVSVNEQTEAALDIEWSGAVAKNAAIKFVVSASGASDGANLSASYIVNNNVAPVVTLSFGACEAALGSAGNAWINNLWQQAAAQGITVLVSSGDSGAAGCDGASAGTATHGAGVNGLCSTPYSTCVGGTEFNDATNASTYWSATSDPSTKGSALQYIPETAWNDSGVMPGGSALWSSGGGASSIYPKPTWQTGSGVPADGHRDVPDVSLTASTHDGYLIYMNGGLYATGGTSAAAPSFAGLMALVNQKTGVRQGNPNPTLYALASQQQGVGVSVFHDVATGTNTVPGLTGFPAGPGYDQATGLGSVDASVMVNHWADATSAPVLGLQLGLSASSISIAPGTGANINVTVAVAGGFNSTVQLSAAGLPIGVTAVFTPATLSAPGSGGSTMTLTTNPQQVTGGSYTIQVNASGGMLTQAAYLTLTIAQPSGFTVALGASSVNIILQSTASASVTVGVTVSVSGSFRAPVALSVAGLPSGLTALLTPAGFAAPGSGSSKLMLIASALVPAGARTIQLIASGGGVTQSASLSVTVVLPPTFILAENQSSASLLEGGSTALTLKTTVVNGFNSTISLSASSLPGGVTAVFSSPNLAAPGAGSSTLTLNAAANAWVGSYIIRITASGGGLAATLPFVITVAPLPSFTLSESAKSAGVQQGSSTMVSLNISGSGGFNSPVSLSVAGLPAGMTASFSAVNVPGAGIHNVILKLVAAASANTGTVPLTITATGGGITNTAILTLSVLARAH
jgi:pseudomonalisin